jgi:hypothetical protein
MRLMLGTKGIPSLLVDVADSFDLDLFEFWVINGAWKGKYIDGCITIYGAPGGDFSSLDRVEILSDNQDRLRGDYNDVFNNFDDVDYVAPKREPVVFDNMDDDIPF